MGEGGEEDVLHLVPAPATQAVRQPRDAGSPRVNRARRCASAFGGSFRGRARQRTFRHGFGEASSRGRSSAKLASASARAGPSLIRCLVVGIPTRFDAQGPLDLHRRQKDGLWERKRPYETGKNLAPALDGTKSFRILLHPSTNAVGSGRDKGNGTNPEEKRV